MIDDLLIGPIILPATMNRPRFLEFLQTEFHEALTEMPLSYLVGMILQLDGAPAYLAVNVRNYIGSRHRQSIGRGGTIAWPPRSPDLIPLE
ncbi:hypothetical protein EVAR_33183_1 [Eumeta japonica]|uniref:Uncharacterized protein n=1 Tax=Eumeta variegata TaxID=151549 RepID=A0A4C1W198_EUMVA|nr:hypothetical protein EVAR_33183_1 [Eumeta japonica]